MDVATQIFTWLCIVTGAAILFAGLLAALAWGFVRVLEYLRVWNVLRLCVAVQLHGKKYRDDLFWKAVRERAEYSSFAAGTIADYALRHKPVEREFTP